MRMVPSAVGSWRIYADVARTSLQRALHPVRTCTTTGAHGKELVRLTRGIWTVSATLPIAFILVAGLQFSSCTMAGELRTLNLFVPNCYELLRRYRRCGQER